VCRGSSGQTQAHQSQFGGFWSFIHAGEGACFNEHARVQRAVAAAKDQELEGIHARVEQVAGGQDGGQAVVLHVEVLVHAIWRLIGFAVMVVAVEAAVGRAVHVADGHHTGTARQYSEAHAVEQQLELIVEARIHELGVFHRAEHLLEEEFAGG